jgi:hypothetical protein
MFFVLYILGWIIVGTLLIYLIVKRIEDRKKENFEDRDN